MKFAIKDIYKATWLFSFKYYDKIKRSEVHAENLKLFLYNNVLIINFNYVS